MAKTIVNGDSLPSRRYLSALLRINPMTVQKAFRLLEEEGLISSVQGSGSFITIDNERIIRIKAELLNDEIRKMIASLKQMGISKDEAVELIVRQWEENSDE
ncbi:MAG: GntR family transcriptional regulator [Erysipelotrichaceae bacterium]|nr:GntR family transcriptional regulator [Erysipelotrichaceae bacterium]MBR2745669.1 GntR family transcriptional regulator [Erysipelotrichaceae bacterium]